MVKSMLVSGLLLYVLAAGPVARAQSYDEDPSPAFNMLGFRTSFGALPLEDTAANTFSLGLGVEHPVFRKLRVFGEYEWLWLTGYRRERAMDVDMPERHGNGQRASVGVRRELFGIAPARMFRVFVDGELGGGVMLVNDSARGFGFVPAALVGLRFGYDFYTHIDESPSSTFEAELLVRAVVVENGTGMMFGIGMLWGN